MKDADLEALLLPCELQIEENLDDTADVIGEYGEGTVGMIADRLPLKTARMIVGLHGALPGLLGRLRVAEADSTELGKLRHYTASLLNDLLNHPDLPASIQKVLWQQRQQLTKSA